MFYLCLNCRNSDFVENFWVCRFYKLGNVKIDIGSFCKGQFFDNIFKIKGDELVGFPISAFYPSHPDRIVIRKKKDLEDHIREKDIWEYYDKVKKHMIVFLKNKDLAVQVYADSGTILKRHKSPQQKEYLKVKNLSDFDELNNGRNVSWYIGERDKTDVAIVDTDPGEGVNFDKIKEHTLLVGEFLSSLDFIQSVEYLFTGKRGFHIWGWLKRRTDIDKIRKKLEDFLKEKFAEDEHITITKKPQRNQIRMDISINKEAGLHICPLSIRFETGLVSWWVPKNKVLDFDKKNYTMDYILRNIKKWKV